MAFILKNKLEYKGNTGSNKRYRIVHDREEEYNKTQIPVSRSKPKKKNVVNKALGHK